MKKWPFFKEHFLTFLTCNLLFLFLQFIYIYYSDSSFIHAITYPFTLYLSLFSAFILQIFLYVLLSCYQTELLWSIAWDKKSLYRWQFFIYFLFITALLAVNCYFFPLSQFSRIFLPELPLVIPKFFMIITLFLIALLTLWAIWQYFRKYSFAVLGFLGAIIVLLFIPIKPLTTQYSDPKKPNLIIIGIDSLSPEYINRTLTPNIHQFLSTSVHFKETITPLARTSAAWTSILTGLYPLHHYARENLYPAYQVKNKASFAWNMQQLGYRTIFASDDRRFNNLGEEVGFQEIIGPRIGANEIVLGSFYDFPLSNLLINFRLSKWLLPYNYINRAGFFSYYPETFDEALHKDIENGTVKKPLFLAVHFTLPHWPYSLASSPPSLINDEYKVLDREKLYLTAVHLADQQVGNLLQFLVTKDTFKNSVVIILSDHGEVLYKKHSRKTAPESYKGHIPSQFESYLKRKTYTELEKSSGHGSDLLSPSQNHCVLGFKIYQQGKIVTKPKAIEVPVSLIDIAPTLAKFFNFRLKEVPDGISLANTILHHTPPLANRDFMLESGMLPNQSMTQEKVIEYAQSIFEVNPLNGLIEVQREKMPLINAMKLYGIQRNEWLLVLYPDDKKYIPVLLRLSDGTWTDDPKSDFAKSSPLPDMLKKLRQFYGDDLASYPWVLNQV